MLEISHDDHDKSGGRGGLSRRQLLQSAALAGMGLAGAGCAQLSAMPAMVGQAPALRRKTSVLILETDDQTYNTIRMMGNAQIQTPNLDALAARGTTMSHCFNQGGWHGAICMASRAMLASGRHLYRVTDPHNARAAGSLQTEHTLWAEHFKNSGYKTFGTGKWHNGGDAFKRSFSHGDAVFLGGMHPYSEERLGGGELTLGHRYPRLKHYDGAAGTFENYEPDAWSTDCYADAAIAFLETHGRDDDPLFTYVSFTAPHDPHHAPQQYMERYNPDDIELPPNFLTEHPFDQGDANVRDEVILGFPRDPAEIRRQIAAYYAMITHLDARIGDILAKLEAVGRLEDTVVLFTADHGLAVGQHGLLGKQNQYDHSVRVPMIWAGPGINPGEVSSEMVYLHCLYATTCELTGLDIPQRLDERSIVPILRGEAQGHDSIIGCYRNLQRMLRTDTHKLIRYPHNGEVQLFDLEADPWEITDLAEQPAHRDRVVELDNMLRRWQTRVGDPIALSALGD